MPPIKPKTRQTFFPHVYSRAQLILLLKATAKNQQPNIAIARPTMRALLILLYGTGARIGEMLSLTIEDVNLELNSIIITNKNPNRCRQIPIGIDLCQILTKYLAWRNKRKSMNRLLFVTKSDKPLTVGMANKNFRRIRHIANVTRDTRATYQPRLQDLQCTFAVH
jgi:integrase/recombinase XerD